MKQQKIAEKVRIQPRIDKDVARLAKAKAIQNEQTFEQAVEALLRAWVSGKIQIVETKS